MSPSPPYGKMTILPSSSSFLFDGSFLGLLAAMSLALPMLAYAPTTSSLQTKPSLAGSVVVYGSPAHPIFLASFLPSSGAGLNFENGLAYLTPSAASVG